MNHATPTPRAHVCTTLPPGDLPLSNRWPDLHGPMYLKSECGRVQRYVRQIEGETYYGPVGAWHCNEVRVAEDGQQWIKHCSSAYDPYLVVDNFGNLVEVQQQRGAP